MVFEFNYKGYAVEFWQDRYNCVNYHIWLGEEIVQDGVFPNPDLKFTKAKELLKGIIDAL